MSCLELLKGHKWQGRPHELKFVYLFMLKETIVDYIRSMSSSHEEGVDRRTIMSIWIHKC